MWKLLFLQLYFWLVIAENLNQSALLVQTEYGFVQGTTTSTSKVWMNVPYAAPPLGSLRWQPPQPHIKWNGILNTTTYGPSCPQPSNTPNQNEDCLYLNIFVPLNATSEVLLPVLFWIHGGSFLSGAGFLYDGSFLNAANVIVVSINYRLGTLGFLAHPALMQPPSEPTTGFYGIQDQRFALQWVQNNIKAFGGDPTKVTVSGESAGAISICVHLVSPKSTGLYSQALMESGFCTVWDESQASFASNTIISNLGCPNNSDSEFLSCLRSKTPEELVSKNTFGIVYPMLQPYEITQQPIDSIMNNSFNPVPLLAGTNLDEMSLFLCPDFPNGLNSSLYFSTLANLYGSERAIILENQYPLSNYPSALQAVIAVQSDAIFKCVTKSITSQFDSYSPRSPSFMYSFEHVPSFAGPCYGVAHSFELPFVFPTGMIGQNLTSEEWVLASTMRDAWAAFVYSGNPSTSSLPWQQTKENNSYMVLDLMPRMESNFDENCEVWPQFN